MTINNRHSKVTDRYIMKKLIGIGLLFVLLFIGKYIILDLQDSYQNV